MTSFRPSALRQGVEGTLEIVNELVDEQASLIHELYGIAQPFSHVVLTVRPMIGSNLVSYLSIISAMRAVC